MCLYQYQVLKKLLSNVRSDPYIYLCTTVFEIVLFWHCFEEKEKKENWISCQICLIIMYVARKYRTCKKTKYQKMLLTKYLKINKETIYCIVFGMRIGTIKNLEGISSYVDMMVRQVEVKYCLRRQHLSCIKTRPVKTGRLVASYSDKIYHLWAGDSWSNSRC